MMRFVEFVAVQRLIEAQGLNEATIGKSAILAQAATARSAGEASSKEVRRALQVFAKARPDDPPEVVMHRLHAGLEAVLRSQMHLRRQLGSALGATVTGHLTTLRALERTPQNKRRR